MEASTLLGAVLGLLAFHADFEGPGSCGYQTPSYSFEGKMRCLRHYAETGDARECHSILKYIRQQKEHATGFVRRSKAALPQLEEEVKKDARNPFLEKEVRELKARHLARVKELTADFARVQEAKEREEKAFVLTLRGAAKLWAQKSPDPPTSR